jgi:metal-responsive CopG/Arc/MetJ family transcriptional regulator
MQVVVVRCSDDLVEKLDAFRRRTADLPSRPEVLRRLAENALPDVLEQKGADRKETEVAA